MPRGLGSFALVASFVLACGTTTAPQKPSFAAPTAAAGAAVSTAELDRESDDEEAEPEAQTAQEAPGPCPSDMVLVETFCVDKYEASLVEIDGDASEKAYPHWLPVDGHRVRAVSVAGVYPQGFISEVQAEDACAASGKRLCSHGEWKTACMGPSKTTFPYGNARQPGTCHDTGKSAVAAVFGAKALAEPVARAGVVHEGPRQASAVRSRPVHSTKKHAAESTKTRASRTKPGRTKKHGPARASTRPASVEASVWTKLNDPRLGQVDGALATTGSHDACANGYGVVDMVGNIHEWVKTDASLPHGTFAGGYYLDTSLNGDGCQYRTTAHAHDYHDYSTGFRCCAEPKK